MGLELNWNLLRCYLKLWENYNEIIFYFHKGTFGPIILLSVVRNFILTNQNPHQQISWTLRFSALLSQILAKNNKNHKSKNIAKHSESSKKLKIISLKKKIKNGRNIKKELEIQRITPRVCRLPRSSIVKSESDIPMQKWTSLL